MQHSLLSKPEANMDDFDQGIYQNKRVSTLVITVFLALVIAILGFFPAQDNVVAGAGVQETHSEGLPPTEK